MKTIWTLGTRVNKRRVFAARRTPPREESEIHTPVNKSSSDLMRKLSRSLFTSFINIHFAGKTEKEGSVSGLEVRIDRERERERKREKEREREREREREKGSSVGSNERPQTT